MNILFSTREPALRVKAFEKNHSQEISVRRILFFRYKKLLDCLPCKEYFTEFWRAFQTIRQRNARAARALQPLSRLPTNATIANIHAYGNRTYETLPENTVVINISSNSGVVPATLEQPASSTSEISTPTQSTIEMSTPTQSTIEMSTPTQSTIEMSTPKQSTVGARQHQDPASLNRPIPFLNRLNTPNHSSAERFLHQITQNVFPGYVPSHGELPARVLTESPEPLSPRRYSNMQAPVFRERDVQSQAPLFRGATNMVDRANENLLHFNEHVQQQQQLNEQQGAIIMGDNGFVLNTTPIEIRPGSMNSNEIMDQLSVNRLQQVRVDMTPPPIVRNRATNSRIPAVWGTVVNKMLGPVIPVRGEPILSPVQILMNACQFYQRVLLASRFRIHDVLFQDPKEEYTIPSKIHGGGLNGGVRKVHRPHRDTKFYAMKTLKTDFRFEANKYHQKNVIQEIKYLTKDHPNFAALRDMRFFNGEAYLFIDWMACTVSTLTEETPGGVHPEMVFYIFRETLAGLIYMHGELESAHGDIKGQNIMLTNCGRVKLIDFGFSGPPGSSQQCGTTGYMAPELTQGHGSGVTPAGDIWALGKVLQEFIKKTPANYNYRSGNSVIHWIVSHMLETEAELRHTADMLFEDLTFRLRREELPVANAQSAIQHCYKVQKE